MIAQRLRPWLWFVPVAIAYAVVATHRMDLPGLYADSVNPDYLVTRILNWHAQRSMTWVLLGNSLLGDRAPVLISLYHGSQQFWLGLPLYALFGTTVTGVRLTHATFALFVLAALYALLRRGGVRAWLAALVACVLALDPAFSYSFRVQAYITVAPAAWLLLGVYSLVRATEPGARKPDAWLFASGAFCGLAAVGYFVWMLVLPPVAVAAVRWTRAVRLARPALVTWIGGLAAGGAAYPLGYLLIARKLASFGRMVDFVLEQQSRMGAFGSQLPLADRARHAWRMLVFVVSGDWHQAMMFSGEFTPLAHQGWKIALLVALPYALWAVAEYRRQATPLLRLLVALPASFLALSLVFGDRLGGHHFAILVPLLYAALGASLSAVPAKAPAAALALLAMASLNLVDQSRIDRALATTRGKGLLSDAIHRFADDLNAMPAKPFVWFAEPALALPLTLLTHGTIPMSDQIDDPEPRQALCAGRDVLMVHIPGHFSEPRAVEWQRKLRWTEPRRDVYAQADGKVVFEVLRYRADRDGPGCTLR
jgi:hypothetical protein